MSARKGERVRLCVCASMGVRASKHEHACEHVCGNASMSECVQLQGGHSNETLEWPLKLIFK